MQKRRLGRSDLYLTPVGLGTWAIGGPWAYGWGPQNDAESVAHGLLTGKYTRGRLADLPEGDWRRLGGRSSVCSASARTGTENGARSRGPRASREGRARATDRE